MSAKHILYSSLLLCAATAASAQSIPVGQLVHDGPATPEQLALLLPVTGNLDNSATATVRYRRVGSGAWIEGHPMLRIRPDYSNFPAEGGSINDDFAWTIIDLEQGVSYEVEVTVSLGNDVVVRTATLATRSLPPAAGTVTQTISPGATASQIQNAMGGLNPGDVVQFENGTYNIGTLNLTRSGSTADPIYIRGESRDGVILESSNNNMIRIYEADNFVMENLTIRGRQTDSSYDNRQTAVLSGGPGQGSDNNTFRNLTIIGVDQGIVFWDESAQVSVYNNTLIGNNPWAASHLGGNRTWGDDGINLPGYGNVAFNNTISGFGDTFAYAQHSGNDTLSETYGVHFYRNEVSNSLDDLVEVDHARRNVSFYDNRSHNSSNCGSLDPLYGGPFIYARNICINPARPTLHKWNDQNSGHFYYSSTIIITETPESTTPDLAIWYQPNNGSQRNYGYRNNIAVYTGGGIMLWLDSGGHNLIDWTHNSWYPNRRISWDGNYNNLAAAQSGLSSTTPVFSGSTRRMQNDNITDPDPWTSPVPLGANAYTEITQRYAPRLASGTAPKNSGVAIPNITDGYSGAAPDRGALIAGRPDPIWGDQNSPPAPSPIRPDPPTDLQAE